VVCRDRREESLLAPEDVLAEGFVDRIAERDVTEVVDRGATGNRVEAGRLPSTTTSAVFR
jgi:hypothetical protein